MRQKRIIVFDDDVIMLRTLDECLSSMGYEVLSFNEPIICPIYSGDSDNCTTEKLCADIILTDYNMPKMNGIELLQKQSQRGCKLDKRNKSIISGYIDEETNKEIQKLDYSLFDKPIELSELSYWLSECNKRIDLSIPLAEL
jgi:CheY-like chemotaxis protein